MERRQTGMELGHGGAAANLGVLLEDEGNIEGAKQAFCAGLRLGLASDDTDAATAGLARLGIDPGECR